MWISILSLLFPSEPMLMEKWFPTCAQELLGKDWWPQLHGMWQQLGSCRVWA